MRHLPPSPSDLPARRDPVAENTDQILGRVAPLVASRERVSGLTIDGPTSLDLDDMLNVHRDGTGYLVEISLANPGAVIHPGEPVDADAANRVSTKYFRTGNDPMLPRRLSENGLSLLPDQTRPTRTVFVPFSSTFVIGKPEMRLTAATSYAQLHYEEAGRAITDRHSPHQEKLGMLARVAEACLEARKQGGAIAFYDVTRGMVVSEDGALVRVRKVDVHAHIIIQEMMILANRASATFALNNELPILFRNHKVRTDTNREFLLRQIADAFNLGTEDSILSTINALSATMGRAFHSPECEGHFALNIPAYAQVSSALRRYQDLLSDRNITAHLLNQPIPHSLEELRGIAQHINEAENESRTAKAAALKAAAEERARSVVPLRLPAISGDTFSQVVKLACAEASPEPGIITALGSRQLALLDIERILFTAPRTSAWQATRELVAKRALEMGPSVAMQLLHQAQQRGVIENHQVQIRETSSSGLSLFHAAVSARYQGRDVRSPEEVGPNRTGASQRAAWRLLFELCELPQLLTPPPALPTAPQQLQPPLSWKNALLEICQAEGASAPEYRFEREGPPHQPLFSAWVHLSLHGTRYDGAGKGTTKIAAEQAAAQQATETIRSTRLAVKKQAAEAPPPSGLSPQTLPAAAPTPTKVDAASLDQPTIQNTSNPKGLLFEWCQRNRVAKPTFTRRTVPLESAPTGQGNAIVGRLRFQEQLVESPEFPEATVKQAEQAASRWLLEELRRRGK